MKWPTLALVGLSLLGCCSAQAVQPESSPVEAQRQTTQDAEWTPWVGLGKPLDHEQATELGRKYIDALEGEDPAALGAIFSIDRTFGLAFYGLEIDEAQREALQEQLGQGYTIEALHNAYHRSLQAGSRMTLLRVVEREGRPTPLLRLSGLGTGFNYLELLTELDPQTGQPQVVDSFSYSTGQSSADIFRKPVEQEMAVDQFDAQSLKELLGAYRRREPEQVLKLYDELPEPLKQEPSALNMRLLSASQLPASRRMHEVQWTARRMQQTHPDNPWFDMSAIEIYKQLGEYEQASAAILRLSERVEGDAWLVFLHSQVWLKAGELEKALEVIEAGMVDFPKDPSLGYWSLALPAALKDEAGFRRNLAKVREHDSVPLELIEKAAGENPWLDD